MEIGGKELDLREAVGLRVSFVARVANGAANAVLLFGEQAGDDVSGYEARSASNENERELLRHF